MYKKYESSASFPFPRFTHALYSYVLKCTRHESKCEFFVSWIYTHLLCVEMYKKYESNASFPFPGSTHNSYVLKCTRSMQEMGVFRFLDLHALVMCESVQKKCAP